MSETQKQNLIPYTELYNDETIKTIEESEKEINLSKSFDSVEKLFPQFIKRPLTIYRLSTVFSHIPL